MKIFPRHTGKYRTADVLFAVLWAFFALSVADAEPPSVERTAAVLPSFDSVIITHGERDIRSWYQWSSDTFTANNMTVNQLLRVAYKRSYAHTKF